jgi:serine/threonine protein kinase
MSDPLGDLLRPAPADPPPDEDEVNLLDGSAEPTDDSPTVISKTPPDQRIKTESDFSGSLRGRRLAHFELIEPIGVGGMAAVLRARDTQLDRLVALKILPPEMANDPENVRRFHREARSAARLDHENIARVFFCGEDQRLHFIAFEFVEGENLRTILERRGRLPVGEALNYMLQVAAGLAHAAGRGVVHRDIKPSNIIITPNGRAKLVDMGLARSLEPQHDLGLTQSGVTLGTFDYISPEQALEPRDADVRSDIYSLGCTFYHMLTGHPPVPEGTAAKKLHHHQHVKPPDPRQFVPDLPDEAAVILDRMMAKQSKDRYQTPEHLVHHLYLAARKLGAAAEVPEGVLAVEAALPNPPAGRPFVLAALAIAAVVGLIFLLDQSSTLKPEPATKLAHQSANESSKPESPDGPPLPPLPQPSKNDVAAKPIQPLPAEEVPCFREEKPTWDSLAKFLEQHKNAHEIRLELADLDLRGRDDRQADLVIANPIVTIRPRTPGTRPTVRDAYHHQVPRGIQASFTIRSEHCTVEDIRFVLNQTGAGVPITALLFRNTQVAEVHRCEFIQTQPDRDIVNRPARPFGGAPRMTSVLAESEKAVVLNLTECCFLGFAALEYTSESSAPFSGTTPGGQDAVTRHGPVSVTASNCVFGPHAAVFHLEGADADKSLVQLEHSSVLMGNHSVVFDVADHAGAHIVANRSLFSRPGEPGMAGMAESKGAVLLRQASRQDQDSVRFEGQQNLYHQLDSYWAAGDAEQGVSDLSKELKKKDKDSRELTSDPWKDAQPLKQLEKLAIQDAFQVDPLLSALRLPPENTRLVGAERVLAFSYLNDLPSLKENSKPEGQRELIVRKDLKKPDTDALLYPTLIHALPDVRPGDVIRLQVDGEIELDSLSLHNLSRADLTLRADRGFHPVLTLSGGNAALFAVYNGRLTLEDLEIHLRAREEDADPQTVVSFSGDGECVLKNCLITLDDAGRGTSLAVLPERKPGKGAHLVLENCFIRGQGCLVRAHGGQFAELKIHNSLIALTGSLLSVESDKELPAAPAGPFTLHLQKCTTYLGEHLIHLRSAKDLKSVAKVQCEAEDCLFLPVGERDRALIRLEGPESEGRGLLDKLSWDGEGKKNAYGSFATLLEQQPLGTMRMMPLPMDSEQWKNAVSRETESEYNVKLPALPAVDAQLLPSAFRTSEKYLKDYGADSAALGALPVLHGKAGLTDLDVPDPDPN